MERLFATNEAIEITKLKKEEKQTEFFRVFLLLLKRKKLTKVYIWKWFNG